MWVSGLQVQRSAKDTVIWLFKRCHALSKEKKTVLHFLLERHTSHDLVSTSSIQSGFEDSSKHFLNYEDEPLWTIMIRHVHTGTIKEKKF